MIEALLIVACVVAAGGYWAWHQRGDAVGIAKGVMQGEYSVPGAPASAVVRRHMSGGRPETVEIQLWTWGVAQTFALQPSEAIALSQALEEAAAEIRGEP